MGIFVMFGCASESSKKKCSDNYTEAVLPVGVTSNWAEVPTGLQVSMGNIDTRYVKHEVPKITATTNWNGSAWKGERVSAQLIIWSKDSVPNVEFNLSDFRSEEGKIISANNAQVRFVRYVITDEYGGG